MPKHLLDLTDEEEALLRIALSVPLNRLPMDNPQHEAITKVFLALETPYEEPAIVESRQPTLEQARKFLDAWAELVESGTLNVVAAEVASAYAAIASAEAQLRIAAAQERIASSSMPLSSDAGTAKTLVEVNQVLGQKWSYWDGDGGLSDPVISIPYTALGSGGNTLYLTAEATLSGYVLATYSEDRQVSAQERIATALECIAKYAGGV